VKLFGVLPDIGGLLKHTPAFPNVKQLRRLPVENAEASLEEIRKSRNAQKARAAGASKQAARGGQCLD
jgi:hypothetical protein